MMDDEPGNKGEEKREGPAPDQEGSGKAIRSQEISEEYLENFLTLTDSYDLAPHKLLTTENMVHIFYPRDLYHTTHLTKRPPNFSSTRTTRF